MSDFRQGRRLAPGIYAFEGGVHVDIDEFCRAAGREPTEANVEVAQRVVERVAAQYGVPVDVQEGD